MEFLVERVGNRSFERGNAATATMMRREKVMEIEKKNIEHRNSKVSMDDTFETITSNLLTILLLRC